MSEVLENQVYALESVVIIDDSDSETKDDEAMPELVDESQLDTTSLSFNEASYGPLPKIVCVESATDQSDLIETVREKVTEGSESETASSSLKAQPLLPCKAAVEETSSRPGKIDAENGVVNHVIQPINGLSEYSKFNAVSTDVELACRQRKDSEEPQQINESLSVSTTNKSDSLQVNVRYERKLCNISRKKCSGIHIKSNEKSLQNVASGSMESSTDLNEKTSPANQMAHYQKLLEVRSRSSGKNNKLSITITSDSNNESALIDDDSDDDCVLMDCTFSCSFCSYTTDKKKTLAEHERNHRRNNYAIFRCIYCNQKYTKHALYTHVQNVHPGQKFYISEEISMEKERASINRLKDAKAAKYWNCLSCSYTTINRHDLVKHETVHENNATIFQCDMCDFRSTMHALRYHKRNHTQTSDKLSKSFTYGGGRGKENGQTRAFSLGNRKKENSPPLLVAACELDKKEKPKPKVKCIECTFYAESAEELAQHLKHHSVESVMEVNTTAPLVKGRQTFKCDQCSYTSYLITNVSRHAKTHKYLTMKQCENCDYQSTANCLKVHRISCSKRKPQKPVPVVFKTKVKTFKCAECAYTTDLQIKLNIHVKKKHSKNKSQAELLRCSHCDHTTNNPYHLEQHMQGHKSRMPTFKCSRCDFTGNMFGLRRHFVKSGHSMDGRTPLEPPRLTPIVKKSEIEPGTLAPLIIESPPQLEPEVRELEKCPKCSYECSSKSVMKQHVRKHKGNPTLVECVCGFKTIQRCMKSHENKCNVKKGQVITAKESLDDERLYETRRRVSASISNTKPKRETRSTSNAVESDLFECRLCSAVFTKSNSYLQHVGKHPSPDKLKKCPNCDFKSSKDLVRRHTTNKECLPTHSTDPDVKKDFRLFAPECRFQCDVCYVPYKTEFALSQHKVSHQNPSKLKTCPECGVRSSGSGLAFHRKVHSLATAKKGNKETEESKIFQCETCSFSTPLRIKLNMHKRKRHSDVNEEQPEPKRLKPNPPVPVKAQSLLKCSLCSYTAPYSASVKRHMHYHNTYPTWQCPNCNYKGTPYMLKMHQCPKEGKKEPPQKVTLSCSKCSFTTYTRSELKAHEDGCTKKEIKLIKNMNAVKSFKCEYCSFTSFWQYLIDRHKQSHEVLKLPIEQCPNCDFKSTPTALSAHLRKCNPAL